LTGHFSHDDYVTGQVSQVVGFDPAEYAREHPTHGELTWRITPASFGKAPKQPEAPVSPPPIVDLPSRPRLPADDIALVVKPRDYDSWKPRAGVNEATAGNELTIDAVLVSPTGGPLTHRAVAITFSLLAVSHFPGVSEVSSQEGQPIRSSPDLQFQGARNPGAGVGVDGGAVRFAPGPFESVTAVLSSFDTRAQGTLTVSAKLDDGRVILGRTLTPASEYLALPKHR
jgi:hypothetical protein